MLLEYSTDMGRWYLSLYNKIVILVKQKEKLYFNPVESQYIIYHIINGWNSYFPNYSINLEVSLSSELFSVQSTAKDIGVHITQGEFILFCYSSHWEYVCKAHSCP